LWRLCVTESSCSSLVPMQRTSNSYPAPWSRYLHKQCEQLQALEYAKRAGSSPPVLASCIHLCRNAVRSRRSHPLPITTHSRMSGRRPGEGPLCVGGMMFFGAQKHVGQMCFRTRPGNVKHEAAVTRFKRFCSGEENFNRFHLKQRRNRNRQQVSRPRQHAGRPGRGACTPCCGRPGLCRLHTVPAALSTSIENRWAWPRDCQSGAGPTTCGVTCTRNIRS